MLHLAAPKQCWLQLCLQLCWYLQQAEGFALAYLGFYLAVRGCHLPAFCVMRWGGTGSLRKTGVVDRY
jgi:hypothetical protein